MAGVAVIGWILFAIVALSDGSFDWHRYISIVGFIVLACAASWGLSALAAITFQTARRWSRRRTGPKRSGPWRGHSAVVPLTQRLRKRAERRGLPGVPILAAAFVMGFGGFFLFYLLTAGDGGTRVNIFRGSTETVPLGRTGNSDITEKSAVQDGAGGGYSLCRSMTQRSCVVDGDTIRYDGSKIRIADIDTPEISEPKCASEAALGHRAKERLLELLNAGSFKVIHPGGVERMSTADMADF
jgi:hypothetical protein